MPRTRNLANESNQQPVLDALSWFLLQKGCSLSVYLSRKGRGWLTLKGYDPITYTTSVEVNPRSSGVELGDAFVVLMREHFPKVIQQVPPLNSWITLKASGDKLEAARTWLDRMEYLVDPDTGELNAFDPDVADNAIATD